MQCTWWRGGGVSYSLQARDGCNEIRLDHPLQAACLACHDGTISVVWRACGFGVEWQLCGGACGGSLWSSVHLLLSRLWSQAHPNARGFARCKGVQCGRVAPYGEWCGVGSVCVVRLKVGVGCAAMQVGLWCWGCAQRELL
jgi:hypothetical protein